MNYILLMILMFLYFFWINTQTYLSTDMSTNCTIKDRIHDSELVYLFGSYLKNNTHVIKFHIGLTTFLLDVNIVGVMASCIWRNNFQAPLLLVAGVILRQTCQFINRLPIPTDMIWFDPGIPSLFMVYKVQNDFFFSGHTLTSLILGLELITFDSYLMKIYSVCFILYEIIFVLVTKSHYWMDVYAAIATYFMMKYFYEKISIVFV